MTDMMTIQNSRWMPKGFGSLYFTQVFSTISFAVLFAGLVLFMHDQLHMTTAQANTLTGVYFAYNFALHLLSGYLGGRIFSYRMLVVVGVIFQLIGCVFLALSSTVALYWGLACMLIGTGTMVTCLNMLLSQLFAAKEVSRRQSAFFWNYSGMNIGFIFGFVLAGYFQLHINYALLFGITAVFNVIALIILVSRWSHMRDRETILSFLSKSQKRIRFLLGLGIVFVLVALLNVLLRHAEVSDILILTVGGIVALLLFFNAWRCRGAERKKLFAFLILLLSAQIFWVTYQLAPMSLTFFAKYNVNLHIWGWQIAPGWIQNINSIAIVIGGPILAALFASMARRKQGSTSTAVPVQYTIGLFLSALGMLILPLGIKSGHHGLMPFVWLFLTYVLQAIAELLISPVGYSIVGQLVPRKQQSFYMGSVLLNTGVAAVLASYFSNYAAGTSGSTNPIVTNPSYSHAFSILGWSIFAVAMVMLVITPFVRRLVASVPDEALTEQE